MCWRHVLQLFKLFFTLLCWYNSVKHLSTAVSHISITRCIERKKHKLNASTIFHKYLLLQQVFFSNDWYFLTQFWHTKLPLLRFYNRNEISKTYMDMEFPYKNKELRFFVFFHHKLLVYSVNPITYIYVKNVFESKINSLNAKVVIIKTSQLVCGVN